MVADKCRNKAYGFGYNAATNTYEDLLQTGVLDPAKVLCCLCCVLCVCMLSTVCTLVSVGEGANELCSCLSFCGALHHLACTIINFDTADVMTTLQCSRQQVTINALENSASIAALVLTTEVLITELPKKEAPMPADPK